MVGMSPGCAVVTYHPAKYKFDDENSKGARHTTNEECSKALFQMLIEILQAIKKTPLKYAPLLIISKAQPQNSTLPLWLNTHCGSASMQLQTVCSFDQSVSSVRMTPVQLTAD